MRVQDVMISRVIVVKPQQALGEVAELFAEHEISGAPVVDDAGRLVGVISQSDLMYRAGPDFEKAPAAAREKTVAEVMTHQVASIAPDASLDAAAALLESKGIDRVPVVAAGRIVGIVSRTDLASAPARRVR